MTREETLCAGGTAMLFFVVCWLLFARRRRRRGLKEEPYVALSTELEAPLLGDDAEGSFRVKSRGPLALRQLLCYALAANYGIGTIVYGARVANGKGSFDENERRLFRLSADGLRCLAWILAARADAAEYKSRRKATGCVLAYALLSTVCAFREARTGPKFAPLAPSFVVLAVHGLAVLVACHATFATADGFSAGWQTGASLSLLNLGGVLRARSPREPRTNSRGPQTFARSLGEERDDLKGSCLQEMNHL